MATAAPEAACAAAASDAKPLSLAELPAAWLQQLPGQLKGQPIACLPRLSLFASCKAMRDLMLTHNSVRLRFQLPLKGGLHGAKESVARASNLAPSVSLVLVGNSAPHEAASEAGSLLSRAMAAGGQALTAIKSVELQGLVLDAVVPSWLTSTCPNRTSLTLHAYRFTNLPAPTATIPASEQLKHLTLISPPSEGQRRTDKLWHGTLQCFEHRLWALPGLQSLSLEFSELRPMLIRYLQYFSAPGSQLTQLSVTAPPLDDEQAWRFDAPFVPQQAVQWFPNVTRLSISWAVRDRDMEALLSMPRIKHLQCRGFALYQSYTHHPSLSWTHLTLQDLNMVALALLPLGSLQSVRMAPGPRLVVFMGQDLEANAWVAGRVSSIDWEGVKDVHLSCGGADIAPMLPLLTNSRVSRLELSLDQLDPECLAAISRTLASVRTLQDITLQASTVLPPVWPLLLPSLPRSVGIVRIKGCDVAVEELVSMCVAAYRSITVCVHGVAGVVNQWEADWEQRVQAAMAEARHDFVLVVRYPAAAQPE